MSQTTAIDWPEMLKAHEPWLRKVLRCRISDAHAVDDLFQEIAVAVFRQLETRDHAKGSAAAQPRHDRSSFKNTLPENPEKVGPWLYRVAIRQAVNFHRKQSRKSQPKIVSDLVVPASSPEPLDWMLHQESDQTMASCIAQLNDGDREILMLKFTEHWSYRQLADHLGISIRAVEHRLLKARKKLRNLLVSAQHEPGEQQ
jgi:RNA polymerase sigma-70 factor (ECF subfamily)